MEDRRSGRVKSTWGEGSKNQEKLYSPFCRGMFPRVFGDEFGDKFGDEFGDKFSELLNLVIILVMNLVMNLVNCQIR